jgi:hypothetical protein
VGASTIVVFATPDTGLPSYGPDPVPGDFVSVDDGRSWIHTSQAPVTRPQTEACVPWKPQSCYRVVHSR